MIHAVRQAREIVIISENKVGVLSNVAKLLADRGVNITAISAQIAGGVALLNFLVDDHRRATDALEEQGFKFRENDVVLVEVDDQPGALRRLTQALVSKKIDILNIYGSAAQTFQPCALVLSTSNNQSAILALTEEKAAV